MIWCYFRCILPPIWPGVLENAICAQKLSEYRLNCPHYGLSVISFMQMSGYIWLYTLLVISHFHSDSFIKRFWTKRSVLFYVRDYYGAWTDLKCNLFDGESWLATCWRFSARAKIGSIWSRVHGRPFFETIYVNFGVPSTFSNSTTTFDFHTL